MSTIPKSPRTDKKGGGNKKGTQRNKGGNRGLAAGKFKINNKLKKN